MSEQTELRALADDLFCMCNLDIASTAELLRRAADRLDRLNAYCAAIEEHGDVL